MKKLLLIAMALAVVFGFTACKGHDKSSHGAWMIAGLAYKLDLSADQKLKLEDVQKAVETARAGSEAERSRDIATVKAQILGDKLDPAVARQLVKSREAKIDANFDAVFEKVQAFHASLNAKQKSQAAEMLEKFSEHWRE